MNVSLKAECAIWKPSKKRNESAVHIEVDNNILPQEARQSGELDDWYDALYCRAAAYLGSSSRIICPL